MLSPPEQPSGVPTPISSPEPLPVQQVPSADERALVSPTGARHHRTTRLWRLLLLVLSCLIGPLLIWLFHMPSTPPDFLPILNAHHQCGKPLPLEIVVEKGFRVRIIVDLTPCQKQPDWEVINMLLPPGANHMKFWQRSFEQELAETPSLGGDSVAIELLSYGEANPKQFFLRAKPYAAALRRHLATHPSEGAPGELLEGAQLSFDLSSAVISRTFATKSLVLFYLADASHTQEGAVPYEIKLTTPVDMTLESSVPEVARILPFSTGLHYDLPTVSNDSGIMLNFRDSSRGILEEIVLFLVSGVFGFAVGLVLERTIFRTL